MSSAASRALVMLCGVACAVAPLSAEQSTTPTVTLGFATGSAGRIVTIPVSLQGAEGHAIRGVVVRVALPADHAEFVRFEPAAILEGSDAMDVVARVVDETAAPAPDTSPPESKPAVSAAPSPARPPRKVLEIRKTSKREDRTLLDGIIGYVRFRIHQKIDVKKTPEVLLPYEAHLYGAQADSPAQPVAVAKGDVKILVEDPDTPIIACFFYMH